MSLGQNICRLRTERKMSQEDFASAMDVSRQSVSKWENDVAVPELEKLIKMSQLFGVSLDELVGNAPPQPKLEPAPAPVPTPAPAAGVTTGDLVSVVLLLLGIIIPLLVIFTSQMHNSLILYILGLCAVPPVVTLAASYCSPKSKLLHRVYLVYNVVFGLLEFLAAAPYSVLLCFINFIIIGFWGDRVGE